MKADPAASAPAPNGPSTDRSAIARWEAWLLVVVVLATLLTRFGSLDTNLLDTGHAHRQTHVAWQSVGFHDYGIDLLHPLTPVLGHPYEIPNEFPLFQAGASVLMSWGMPPDPAHRVVGLGSFIATALLLWLIVRKVAGPTVAAVTLVVFSFSPFALVWSRAAVVEYLATAATLGWILAAWYWLETRRVRWIAVGLLSGSIAALVKGSTPITWLPLFLAVGAVSITDWRRWGQERRHVAYGALLVVPWALLQWWTAHADGIKAANEATRPLTVVESRGYWIGTIGQRLDGGNWGHMVDVVERLIIGYGWLVPVIVAAFIVRRRRDLWLAMLFVPIVGIGGLFGSYLDVEYYFAAASPALAALVGLAIVSLFDWIRLDGRNHTMAVIGMTALWVGLNVFLTNPYWSDVYRHRGTPPESAEIAALTDADDRVLVGGFWYDPRILYYADRWGLMLAEPWVTLEFVESRPDLDDYTLLYSSSPKSHLVDWAAVRPWYAPLTENSLRLGSSLDEVADDGVAATTESLESLVMTSSPGIIVPTEISCDGGEFAIPAGSGPIWIGIESDGDSRPILDVALIPVPAGTRTIVRLPDQEGRRSATMLGCYAQVDGATLRIIAAIEAPIP